MLAADITFGDPIAMDVGTNPEDVLVADFNGDGNLDIAAANASSNDVSLLMGNGDGTFQEAVNYANLLGEFSLVNTEISAGDLNGDGVFDQADIVAAMQAGAYSAG